MSAKPTRTLNPLPFLELEPHRFEDLVRQLAYDFRDWHSLEAIGRSGGDEGMDIRGIERVIVADEGEDDEDDPQPTQAGARTWIFQCKREKAMGPKRVREAVAESLPDGAAAPHGFVLAVACDLSKTARDAFRAEVVGRGVEEFFVWARGELEDLLFQARNDRLLFVYFGLSLQPRRRSLGAGIRSQVALKKQLRRLFEDDDNQVGDKYVLLRDPTDDRYPHRTARKGEPRARWLLCAYLHVRHPRHMAVLAAEHLAWVPADQRAWDALTDHNLVPELARLHLRAEHAWQDDEEPRTIHRDFWNEYVPEPEQAYLKVMRVVSFERIVAIDPIGDGYHPIPHVFVEFDRHSGPFDGDLQHAWFQRPGRFDGTIDMQAVEETRVAHFPRPLPATVYPAPAGFHRDVPMKQRKLSATGRAELDALIKPDEGDAPPANAGKQERNADDERVRAFRQWRDEVVLPVFGAIDERLRSAGFGARIVVLEAPPDQRFAPGRELVELRVQATTSGKALNPDYRPRGHVRYALVGWNDGTAKLDTRPLPTTGGAIRRDSVEAQPGQTTREQVEKHVLDMLDRLKRE